MSRGHWILGVGQVGCLHDHQERDSDLNALIALAREMYGLSVAQGNDLRWHKIVYFEGQRRAENGDYIELMHSDEPLADDE